MGMRYAFMGPMETIHLNAEGTQNYCDRYGEVSSTNQLLKTNTPTNSFTNTNYKSTTYTNETNWKLSYPQTIYNVSSDLGPIPTGWKQETEKDKAEVAANTNTITNTNTNTGWFF